jgi:hypothetical protein
MVFFWLLIGIGIAAALYFIANSSAPKGKKSPLGGWLADGVAFGLVLLVARVCRLPAATILGALPLLLRHLQQNYPPSSAPFRSAMSKEEARLILGIPATAGAEEIKEAHRKLIQKTHPDAGGSAYLAAKVNEARDILLRG